MAVVIGVGAAVVSSGCVQVAACDDTVACPQGQVCFRYECRETCDEDGECQDSEAVCRPCEDPTTRENRCFGRDAHACVVKE